MPNRKRPDKFPLWLHPRGQWCKKIAGHFHYFGKDRDAALAEYVRVREDLEAGRTPRPKDQAARTVAEVVNAFLTEKRNRVDAEELTQRAWADYFVACEAIIESFGRTRAAADLRPEDFAKLRAKAAGRLGSVALLNFITRVRMVFKFGYEFGLIDAPVRYGAAFDRPTRQTLRRERAKKPAKLIPAADLWTLIGAADPQLRCMIFLGLNGGFGSSDCSQLTRAALTTRPGWVEFPRPKTGIPRRFPLWTETAAALAAVTRPGPCKPEYEPRVFLTRLGQPWVRFRANASGKGTALDAVGPAFRKLGKKCGVELPGAFYTLRHVHRTVSDGCRDRPAVDMVMGHTDPSVADRYREKISDERLQAVVDHVRLWLLAGRSAGGG